MKIPTDEIPQANNLKALAKAVQAVADGATTYQGIAASLGYGERQGRYYRLAGEMLGLLEKTGVNAYRVTALGRAYLSAEGPQKSGTFAAALANSRLFQRVVTFLESKKGGGATKSDLEQFIAKLTETTKKMVGRRTSTVISWLKAADLLDQRDHRYVLRTLGDQPAVVDYGTVDEPLMPRQFDLQEYTAVSRRVSSAQDTITYEVERAKLDRANSVHETLTNLVARKIRGVGAIPKRNPLVDLAAQIGKDRFIFEVKTTPETEFRNQVRRGVSQLYEYRYLQDTPDAKLVLVIEKPLPRALQWMTDYLVKDRGIFLVWDGDLRTLHSLPAMRRPLEFLL